MALLQLKVANFGIQGRICSDNPKPPIVLLLSRAICEDEIVGPGNKAQGPLLLVGVCIYVREMGF